VTVVNKPQTPLPPFFYKSEDVIYTNGNGSIQYGATLTIPFGEGPFPAVVLITGSGQQNRDEEFAGHKPFAVIADHLTTNGIAVLRIDDRGVGQTTGDVMSSTTLDFADDIGMGLDYLKSLFIDGMVQSFSSPWFQYFLKYEPQQYLEKLACKVLAVNGSRDIQILSKPNLTGIEAALRKSRSKDYEIKEYEGLNHLLQKCKMCTVQEYGGLQETISMDVLNDVAAWLKKAL